MKYKISNAHYAYLGNALTELTENIKMNEEGTFVDDDSGEHMGIDRLPLTVLYYHSMSSECVNTYESAIGETHFQWVIDPTEAMWIPGCLDLINSAKAGYVLDIWTSDQNGFVNYQLKEAVKESEGARRVRVSVDIYLNVDDFDEDNFNIENYVYIVPKEDVDEDKLNLSWTTNEIDGVEDTGEAIL